ncbi:hypothetical protein ABW19_dt0206013 [Dactylella cylindrospora]|nr:hypothetical protein ABW19_dt0206013 [Dactylella cylindrospora]
MVLDKIKGKEADVGSDDAVGTFEDPHKLTFSIKDLPANSVVLYPDQAQITREIENVQLKPGVNEVTIKDLTGYCQEHSIKVEGKGDAIITDMVVESVGRSRGFAQSSYSDDESEEEDTEEETEEEQDSDEDPDFADIRKIDEEIKELRVQANDAAEQLRNADIQLQALERYGATITAEVALPETMTQFLDMYQESRKNLYEQHKEAKATITRLEKEYAKKVKERTRKLKSPTAAKLKLEKEKAKERAKKNEKKNEKRDQKLAARSLRPASRFRVKVMVETTTEAEASLTLKYLVNNATWYPRYDLRLDSIAKSGQIIYRAHFENKTYETWRDAKITFSSSAQTFGGLSEVVPIMTPWTLSLRKGAVFGSSSDTDNTAGLYSIKEQQALAKRGVYFGNNNNNVKNALPMPQQQMHMQQQQIQRQSNIIHAQQAQFPASKAAGGLFGNANNAPAASLFGQTQTNIGFGSTLGDRERDRDREREHRAYAPAFGTAAAPQPLVGGLFGSTSGEATEAVIPPPPGGPGSSGEGGGAPGDGDDGASTLAPARAAMMVAESSSFESYGMTTTYEISGLRTIKSSPLTRRQVITTIELPTVTFTSIAVAKLRSAAFLKARFKNVSKHTLLRGVAGLTVDGSFLGQTTIPHCPTDDTVSLSLGVDTGVHVSYAKPTLVSSSQGFISKENVTLYKRSIFIHNAKSQPLTLTVLDQVPVSEDERLRVNVINPKGLREGGEPVKTGAPGSVNLDSKWGTATAIMKATNNGEITYTVKLEKGRSCKLPLEYEVKLPAGEKIVGLT